MTLMDMIDDLTHDDHIANLPEWTGISSGQLVTDYQQPDELDAAWDRWIEINGRFNSYALSMMWHRSLCSPPLSTGDHTLDLFDIDLRCAAGAHESRKIGDPLGRRCQCVGELTSQIICGRCSWHHIGAQSECIEAWHDHAFPGWRDLPVLSTKLRGSMGGTRMTPKVEAWLNENYPVAFRVPRGPHPHRARRTRHPTCPQLQPLRRIRPLRHQPALIVLIPLQENQHDRFQLERDRNPAERRRTAAFVPHHPLHRHGRRRLDPPSCTSDPSTKTVNSPSTASASKPTPSAPCGGSISTAEPARSCSRK